MKNNKNGFTLIILLILIAVLTVFVMEYHYSGRVGIRIVEGYKNGVKALYAAKSGVNIAAALLEQEELIDSPLSKSGEEYGPFEIDGAEVSFRIEGEDGKININRLSSRTDSDAVRRSRIEQLLELCDIMDIGYGIVPAIIDWADEDDVVTVLEYVERDNRGAEESYYQRQAPPYHAKNGPFDTVKELLFVKDMTGEILFGDIRAGEDEQKALIEFLTVYGDGKINVNTAPPVVLQCLAPEIDEYVAGRIVAAREDAPFEDVSSLRDILEMDGARFSRLSSLISVKSEENYFRIKSEGSCGASRRTINAVVRIDEETGAAEDIVYWEQT